MNLGAFFSSYFNISLIVNEEKKPKRELYPLIEANEREREKRVFIFVIERNTNTITILLPFLSSSLNAIVFVC